MVRYDGKIYHRKPFEEHTKDSNSIEIERPKKRSEIAAELKDKIAGCKIFLRDAGSWVSEKKLEEIRMALAKYERQLANLPQQKRHRIKKTYKKMSQEKIREYALKQIKIAKKNGEIYVMAEDIAHQINVKPHFVHQVFQQFNIEGILSQPIHHAPHDSNRDPWGFDGINGWMADLYRIIDTEEEDDK